MLWDPNKDKPVETELDAVGLLMHRTADYLETHRWCKNHLYYKGAVCMLGALIKVDTGCKNPDHATQSSLVNQAIIRIAIKMGLRIVGWNDDPGRKKSEVIAVLREAAKTQT